MEKYCSKCLIQTGHEKSEEFDTLPNYLIVIINRGKDHSIRIYFKPKKKINLIVLIEIKVRK